MKNFTYDVENFDSDVCSPDSTIDSSKVHSVECGECEKGSILKTNNDGSYKCEAC